MDEEEKEEQSPEDKEKWDKIRKKTDAFMAEIGQDALDDEAIEKTEEHTKTLFKDRGIPWQTATLRAFIEGTSFCLGKESQTMLSIHMAQRVILKKMEEKLKKTVDASLKGTTFGDELGRY